GDGGTGDDALDLDRGLAVEVGLGGRVLATHGVALAQGQYDGADHDDQQDDDAGQEAVDGVRIEHPTERHDVRRVRRGGDRPGGVCGRAALDHHDRDHDHRYQQDAGHDGRDRQVGRIPFAEADEVDVQHHHDEEEQHRDGADVDDHQQHRQELRAQ